MVARTSIDRRYKQLLDASFWGRWQEALDQIPKLKGALPDFELDARAALALAALGRLDAGLELLKPYADSSRVPGWIYWMRLADLYFYANDQENYQVCIRRGVESGPELPIVKLDQAQMLLDFSSDFTQVEQIIAQLEEERLDEQCVLVLLRFKGVFHFKAK